MAKKGATGDFFFHFCKKNGQYFHGKKSGEKKIAAARLASIIATCWTGNRFFFMDSLTKVLKGLKLIFPFLRPYKVLRIDNSW